MAECPTDLINEMFLRLRATTLVKCRVLSKPCFSLIDSPEKRVIERSNSPPPPLGFNNHLLPLANAYDDDDEEEGNELKKSQARRNGVAKGEGNGNKVNGEAQEEVDDEEDDDDDASKGRGKHSRHVEVRRDCPHLDTVNRQVIIIDQFLMLRVPLATMRKRMRTGGRKAKAMEKYLKKVLKKSG
ncbi:hypothetical protein ISN45_At04g023550 [Arabidopsis thaliana x Arabidopsis arenosa]|uniref:F-box protein n=1 Tax=Arabidopsis thaliana x Arabidopsis arenosa TaxID=1240361 RepID=A0A8T2E0B0_9BRAS|nr:hypothetical protein ISN45_At04g023550 [Arabidopsis thaliana x Arabidopsis arenosa]